MVLRSQSVGEQDVADQQGAFFCAGGSRVDTLSVCARSTIDAYAVHWANVIWLTDFITNLFRILP